MHRLLYSLSAFFLASSLFAADPFAGTWWLNLAKSKYAGPVTPPKEETLIIQEQGDLEAMTINGIAADSSPISRKATYPKTGGEVHWSEGGPGPGASFVV